jgi:hypothetical protein
MSKTTKQLLTLGLAATFVALAPEVIEIVAGALSLAAL